MDDDPSMNPGAGGPGAADYAREMGEAADAAVFASPSLQKRGAQGLIALSMSQANRSAAAMALIDIRNDPKFIAEAKKALDGGCNPETPNMVADMLNFAMLNEKLGGQAGGKRHRRKLRGGEIPKFVDMAARLIHYVCFTKTAEALEAAEVAIEGVVIKVGDLAKKIDAAKLGKTIAYAGLTLMATSLASGVVRPGPTGVSPVGAVVSGVAYAITSLMPEDPLALWKNGASEIAKILTVPIEAVKANPKFYMELALSAATLNRVIKHGKDALEGRFVKGIIDDAFYVLGFGTEATRKSIIEQFEETEGWKDYEETANLTKRLNAARAKGAKTAAAKALADEVATWHQVVRAQWTKVGDAGRLGRLATFDQMFPPGQEIAVQYPGAVAAPAAAAADEDEDSGAGAFPPGYQAPPPPPPPVRERSRSRERDEEGTALARYGSPAANSQDSQYYEDEMGREVPKPTGRGRRTGGTRRKARRSFRRSMRRKSHKNSKKRMNKRK